VVAVEERGKVCSLSMVIARFVMEKVRFEFDIELTLFLRVISQYS
jgi:hypothetical protein